MCESTLPHQAVARLCGLWKMFPRSRCCNLPYHVAVSVQAHSACSGMCFCCAFASKVECAAAYQSDPTDSMACVSLPAYSPRTQQQKPSTPDPSASHVRLAYARQPYQLLQEEEPFYQAQEQSLFPDDGDHDDDFHKETRTRMTLDAPVEAPLITAKTLSPNLVRSHATRTRTHTTCLSACG